MTRLRVLAVARLCNPEWSSVPFVGWNHAWAFRAVADVHLVTHRENREAIERSAWPKAEVTYVAPRWYDDLFHWALRRVFKHEFGKVSLTAFAMPFYWAFEREVWRGLGPRIEGGAFDVVHRLTPVSPVLAGSLAARCAKARVPFVLGPLNGGLPWPTGYPSAASKERELLSSLRFLYPWVPFVRRTRRAASAIVVASRNTWAQIPARYHEKLFYVPENAIDTSFVEAPRARGSPGPLRIAFLGRLVPYKGCDLVLKAAAPLLRDGRALLTVIGWGSEREPLERLAAELGVTSSVRFLGELKHRDAMARLSESDVFAFPSIREFGGAVVVEAMARGVVPIVVDYGGPGEIVAEGTGFRLPLTDEGDTTRRLAELLAELARDKSPLLPMARAAREHVLREWTWASKAEKSQAIHRFVRDPSKGRPPLAPPPAAPR